MEIWEDNLMVFIVNLKLYNKEQSKKTKISSQNNKLKLSLEAEYSLLDKENSITIHLQSNGNKDYQFW